MEYVFCKNLGGGKKQITIGTKFEKGKHGNKDDLLKRGIIMDAEKFAEDSKESKSVVEILRDTNAKLKVEIETANQECMEAKSLVEPLQAEIETLKSIIVDAVETAKGTKPDSLVEYEKGQ